MALPRQTGNGLARGAWCWAASGRRTPVPGPGRLERRRRSGATRRPRWTVPRWRGCGAPSRWGARSRRSAGGARYRPTAAGRLAARGRCPGPGRSSTGRRARGDQRPPERWLRSGPGPRTGRPGLTSASIPAWSSRALIMATWLRRAATCMPRTARLSPRASGDGPPGRAAVMMPGRPARRTSSCARCPAPARPAGPARRRRTAARRAAPGPRPWRADRRGTFMSLPACTSAFGAVNGMPGVTVPSMSNLARRYGVNRERAGPAGGASCRPTARSSS